MEYYIFDAVSPNADAPFVDLPDEVDLLDVIYGKKLEFTNLPITATADIDEDDNVFTDIIDSGAPLYSDRLKNALEKLGVDNIDYFPVNLIDSETNEVVANYWMAIIIGLVSCLDSENSTITVKSGRTFITHFSIDDKKAQGLKLFRFYDRPRLIIINEKLKNELSVMGFKGVSFLNTKKFDRKF